MRLTVALDERDQGMRVLVERALDYPPGHIPGFVAAAVAAALAPPADAAVEDGQLVPAPRRAPHDEALRAVSDPELGETRLRRRVLRALDEGATVAEAARRFGIEAAVIDRWDDDAASDARIDLLADTLSGSAGREAS